MLSPDTKIIHTHTPPTKDGYSKAITLGSLRSFNHQVAELLQYEGSYCKVILETVDGYKNTFERVDAENPDVRIRRAAFFAAFASTFDANDTGDEPGMVFEIEPQLWQQLKRDKQIEKIEGEAGHYELHADNHNGLGTFYRYDRESCIELTFD